MNLDVVKAEQVWPLFDTDNIELPPATGDATFQYGERLAADNDDDDFERPTLVSTAILGWSNNGSIQTITDRYRAK